MKKAFVKVSLALSGLLPAVTWVAAKTSSSGSDIFNPNDPNPELPDSLPQPAPSFSALIKTINKLAIWMFSILMALGVVFILWAAFQYLTSQGDTERVKAAKQFLVYAIVAMVVGVLAGSVSVLVQQFALGIEE